MVTDPRTVSLPVLDFPLISTCHCSREWNLGELLLVKTLPLNQVEIRLTPRRTTDQQRDKGGDDEAGHPAAVRGVEYDVFGL